MRRRLLLELGVLAALLMSFLTIPLPIPHVATGTLWVALTAVHVARRRRIYAALLRSANSSAPPTAVDSSAPPTAVDSSAPPTAVDSSAPPTVARRQRRRLVASTMLIGSAAVVALSGFAQWAGVAAAIPWHAGGSMLLIVLAAAHASRRLWRMRRHRVQLARSKSLPFVTFCDLPHLYSSPKE